MLGINAESQWVWVLPSIPYSMEIRSLGVGYSRNSHYSLSLPIGHVMKTEVRVHKKGSEDMVLVTSPTLVI